MAAQTIIYLSDPARFAEQERLYLRVRDKEGWVMADEQVRALPVVPAGDRYMRLWRWRRASLRRLIRHIKRTNSEKQLRLLDIGCGNGWMSNQLALELNAEVWAVDVNRPELEQGARLFGSERLQFYFADVYEAVLPEAWFDVIVLAGSMQYFEDPATLSDALKRVLRPGGAVHIIDTNFYQNEAARRAAGEATRTYYAQFGLQEMAAFFHHYTLKEVGGENLNDRIWIRFLQKIKALSPFPWIKIQH